MTSYGSAHGKMSHDFWEIQKWP